VVNVRGLMVLNGVRFVSQTFGSAQHEAVLARLPADCRGVFLGSIRDVSWTPLANFVAYMEAARSLLAPADEQFFRNLGRFAGSYERAGSNFKVLVADPLTAMRLAPVTWRAFHDAGRLEIEPVNPHESLARLYEFPASAAMCERRCGAWETLLSNDEFAAQVSETRCQRFGDSFCETHTVWLPR
jgi:hypothetical protein